ncbi:MAG TPA: CpsD/CapB family tyrosine-protein kinase [Vicinamibacterales bacterium]|nr:CpsD/CapB family tyrosine-protein kinase [Vicinamibacterales bacterium]
MINLASTSALPFVTVAPDGDRLGVRQLADRPGSRLIISRDAPPGAVEQYRRLAATLHHAQQQAGLRAVMVASAMPTEGKTLTAANLAVTLSESYRRRVLVIDADLRRPTMHVVFQLPNLSGLNEALGGSPHRPSAFQVSPHLTVLPAGRPTPDPMGALTSQKMGDLIRDASAAYDWVIVDTPPVGLLSDANLLARIVDGVVMVISAGKVSYKLIQRSVDAVGRERILGVVLNRANDALLSTPYRYNNYYGYGPKA